MDNNQTHSDWCLYRAVLSCKIGREALDGNVDTPPGVSDIEYALYNLLHAVQEIAEAMKTQEVEEIGMSKLGDRKGRGNETNAT